ncbi:helix-turn-helix domain-containing protein [Pectobacterium betavasculorum]|nr:helix-turn-helix domain-containing protein [Pectobacterium betavasculorum]
MQRRTGVCHQASRYSGMVATLRRRLSAEQTRFDVLLLETRMQHAMMLVQTTSWSMQRLAEACGYKSSARFSEQFKNRFGCSPTKIR